MIKKKRKENYASRENTPRINLGREDMEGGGTLQPLYQKMEKEVSEDQVGHQQPCIRQQQFSQGFICKHDCPCAHEYVLQQLFPSW